MLNIEKHQHKTNKLVRDTLKKVGKLLNTSYPETLNAFRAGDDETTISFWDLIYLDKSNIKKYNRVDFCHGCKKFNMYYAED